MTVAEAFNLADQYQRAGDLPTAESIYRQILTALPDHVDALHRLGIVLYQQSRPLEAVEVCRRVVARRPDFAEAFNILGIVLHRTGQGPEALAAYVRATELKPDFAEAFFNLANALADTTVATATERSRLERAIAAYRHCLRLRPDLTEASNNLGNLLATAGSLDEASKAFRGALAIHPESSQTWANLAAVQREAGELDEAIASYRRSLDLRPDSHVAGQVLFTMHCHPEYDGRRLFEEHTRWYQQYAQQVERDNPPLVADHWNDPRAISPLRVGYVAHQLGDQPLGRFLLPLIRDHNRASLEVFCYCDTLLDDDVGRQFLSNVSALRSTAGLSDEELVNLVRSDRIHILVDLALHTGGNRLLCFARRPAPVQITYLAYCSTTGLRSMDYRFTDPYLDPPGRDESIYCESSIRLPTSYWCYQPHLDAPPLVSREPTGAITFGCLNSFFKVTSRVLEAWRQILAQVPRSRLVLHAKSGSHRERVANYFAGAGVDRARLGFVNQLPIAEYFRRFDSIDICLDTFPWSGGTTTCDALWMGVPVVTLAGATAVGRGGVSILSNIGLTELVATDSAQYVRIAVALAEDRKRLGKLKMSLRERMKDSALMDADGFVRQVEETYRHQWHDWCSRRESLARGHGIGIDRTASRTNAANSAVT